MNIVFDIDGTLSDPSHRLHYLGTKSEAEHIAQPDGSYFYRARVRKPSDWDAFYNTVQFDPPIPAMIRLARILQADAQNHIEFWTGRPERIRDATEAWLEGYGLVGDWLYMRADDDRSPDVELKEKWLAYTMYRPDLVFEDRKRVVDMYRSRGILVCQPAPGDY